MGEFLEKVFLMKKIVLGLLLLSPFLSAELIWGNDGSYTNKIGNSYYHSDGSSSMKIGNTMYNSDGSSDMKIGNTYYNSNGGSSTKIGNAYIHNDSGANKSGSFRTYGW
jgi:hypothetical protein